MDHRDCEAAVNKLQLNYKLEKFLTVPKPLKLAIGGRGSGKSIGIADMLCFEMLTKKMDVLCLREHQNSISESVHKTIAASISDRLKLTGWTIQENRIIAPSGAYTAYKGMARNPDAVQSASGFRRSWFEEAHRASEDSIDKLIPTILRMPGAECWFTANPQSSGDPFSKRFINPFKLILDRDGFYEDEMHLIVVLNWRDNPWWSLEQDQNRLWDYNNTSRAKYNWIWEGEFNDSVEDSVIKPEWFDAAIDAHIKLGFDPLGAIVAAHDPSDSQDAKGFCLRHGSVILDVDFSTAGDSNSGCDWALDKAIHARAEYFVWDCDGLGVSLNRQVQQALHGKRIEPVMFKGSEMPSHPDAIYQDDKDFQGGRGKTNKQTFRNRRAQYYINLRDRFRRTYDAVEFKKYVDPDDLISVSSKIRDLAALRSELCRIPRKPNGTGLIQIMSKDEMKKIGISSPNMADSVMMSFHLPEDLFFDDKPLTHDEYGADHQFFGYQQDGFY
ncbi:MAG: PBSX family phage terminase large subunit [Magnetococcales bacterium]|nr:PBSX family phage terminase large subunit [Magnetococcales bacterium]